MTILSNVKAKNYSFVHPTFGRLQFALPGVAWRTLKRGRAQARIIGTSVPLVFVWSLTPSSRFVYVRMY